MEPFDQIEQNHRLYFDQIPYTHDRLCMFPSTYGDSPMYWYDEHEERLSRSLDGLDVGPSAPSINGVLHEQPMSLSSIETSRKNTKRTQRSTSDNTTVTEEKDHAAILKTKLLSAFTNVKNGWVVKSSASFKRGFPIWLLGCQYECRKPEETEQRNVSLATDKVKMSFDNFKLDFSSRIWMTYRKDFPKLDGSQLTSDIGWGCMLRSGQMLIAQALVVHFLGREWMWNKEKKDDSLHRQIIRYFGDSLHRDSPFSLQTLVAIGRKSGRNPGDWYGPASISNVLRDALEQVEFSSHPQLNKLSIYVAMDGAIFVQDVLDLCYKKKPHELNEFTKKETRNDESEFESANERNFRSVIILIPLRLGSESLNEIYVPCLKTILCNELCIGIIGGKPKHSMYFVGWQDERLILLDPHCCQDSIDVIQDDFPLETFHCQFPRKLPFNKMDPTCTIAFYCRTRLELDTFMREGPKCVMPPGHEDFPLFYLQNGSRAEFESDCRLVGTPSKAQSVRLYNITGKGSTTFDDFTLL